MSRSRNLFDLSGSLALGRAALEALDVSSDSLNSELFFHSYFRDSFLHHLEASEAFLGLIFALNGFLIVVASDLVEVLLGVGPYLIVGPASNVQLDLAPFVSVHLDSF